MKRQAQQDLCSDLQTLTVCSFMINKREVFKLYQPCIRVSNKWAWCTILKSSSLSLPHAILWLIQVDYLAKVVIKPELQRVCFTLLWASLLPPNLSLAQKLVYVEHHIESLTVLVFVYVVHKRLSGTSANSSSQSVIRPDARADVLAEQPELATNFIKYVSIICVIAQ